MTEKLEKVDQTENINQAEHVEQSEPVDQAGKFDRILDIKLEITTVLGRTKMSLKDIFELTKGSLIELDTLKNQELEIFVNGRKIGYGEVVIVGQNFGVRITNILGEQELVKTLS